MAVKISGTTVIDNSRNLVNVLGLKTVGGTSILGSGNIPTNGASAWVNFNAQGTVTIGASLNVSSVTDNGTGDFTINFTTAMTDANYAAAGFAVAYGTDDPRSGLVVYQPTGTATFVPLTKTTSAARIIVGRTGGAVVDDMSDNSFIVYR